MHYRLRLLRVVALRQNLMLGMKIYATLQMRLCLCNTHDKSHNKECLRPPDFECCAQFPRKPMYEKSFVEEDTGSIPIKKNEAWINKFNIVLSYLM